MSKNIFTLIFILLIARYSLGAPRLTCRQVFLDVKKESYQPGSFTRSQVLKLLKMLKRSTISNEPILGLQPKILAFRRDFFDYIYGNGIVRAPKENLLLADKLIFTRFLERVLGSKFDHFHIRGMGLKEFLSKYDLVTPQGQFKSNFGQFRKALEREFPDGFVLKPLLTVNSAAEGFIHKPIELFVALKEGDAQIYRPSEFFEATQVQGKDGKIVGLASGERYILQQKIPMSAIDVSKVEAMKIGNEYRVHTYGREVVPDATVARWYGEGNLKDVKRVNDFIENFLASLPREAVDRQVFSFDVMVVGYQLKIVELNTNFGQAQTWSGFTSEPHILAAYVRFFENKYNWSFGKGVDGMLLRSGLANMKVHAKNEILFSKEQFKKGEDMSLILRDLQNLHSLSREYLEVVPPEAVQYRSTVNFLKKFVNRWNEVDKNDPKSLELFFRWAERLESM